jgi:hypothetical protein
MSNNRILGKNQIVEMNISGNWYPFFCCKSMDFAKEQELIEVTSVNSVSGREYEAGMSTAKLNVSGVSIIDNTNSQISLLYLMPDSQMRVAQSLRIRFTAENGTTKQMAFSALITILNTSRTFGAFSQSSVSFVVTGGITIGPVDPPGPVDVQVYADYWETVNGQSFIDGSSSGTSPSSIAFGGPFTIGGSDTILLVTVEGTEFEIITSGAPGNRECKFDSMLGQIRFDPTLIFDGTQRVYVNFKRTT